MAAAHSTMRNRSVARTGSAARKSSVAVPSRQVASRSPMMAVRPTATQGAGDHATHPHEASLARRQVLSALLASAVLLPTAGSARAEGEAEALVAEATADAVAESVAEVMEVAAATEAVAEPVVEVVAAPQASTSVSAGSKTSKVFMDLTINGEPAGRISMELFGDVPSGAGRFAGLAAGRQGVDYRLSKFNGVLPTYIRNAGLNRLSYSATEVSPISGVDAIDDLEAELEAQTRRHDQAGLVSLIVLEATERPTKERLVARDGKLITVLEQAGEAPNGTMFTITTAASPELDATNLIIGRVVEGSELLERISKLPVNRPRNDNPYFAAGKAMGDKRAVTAERAFYRPFQKVVVAASGLLS